LFCSGEAIFILKAATALLSSVRIIFVELCFKVQRDSAKKTSKLEEEEEETKSIDADQLFQLSEIAFLVELALATAEKDTSKIQLKNRQDVYRALTDSETLDAILRQGLDEKHQKYKDSRAVHGYKRQSQNRRFIPFRITLSLLIPTGSVELRGPNTNLPSYQ
jgi:hypothetical protein